MFFGLVYLLCWRMVCVHSVVVNDPLEQCTNLFSQTNLPKRKFDALQDPKGRQNENVKKCNDTLYRLYELLRSSPQKTNLAESDDIGDPEKIMMTNDNKKFQNPRDIWEQIEEMKKNNLAIGSADLPVHCMSDQCNKLYDTLVVDLMPFSYQMIEAISKSFEKQCCDYAVLCASPRIVNMSQINKRTISGSHIVFPVLGRSSSERIYGYYFIPVYDAPSAYYFSSKQSKESVSNNIAQACQNLWPLFTICLLLALISGFVAWSIETRVNDEEFPKTFHVGLFEGFWWSFISMTTVGYGDKTPKSIAGRVFSIIWILVGITICSMFTASLTTEITKWTTPSTPTMSGKKVAVLKYRLLDSLIVAKQGGIIREVDHNNVSEGIERMMNEVKSGNVSGFVIDTVTYHYSISSEKQKGEIDTGRNVMNDIVKNFIRTKVSYDGEHLSFGVLFKELKDFQFFRDSFRNQLYLEACYYLQMNENEEYTQEKDFLFDPAGGLFYSVMYYIISALGLIVFFGTLYELKRKGKSTLKLTQREVEGDDDTRTYQQNTYA